MPRLWAFCLLLASAQALPSAQLNRSCRLSSTGAAQLDSPCSQELNLSHIQLLERYMRPELDACEDFYQYACGNWYAVQPPGVSAMSLSSARIVQRFVELFERLLDDPRAPEHGQPMYAKLLRYYQSCRALGMPRLRRYLEQLPHVGSGHWSELLAVLGRYGYHEHFVQIEVSQHNASRHMIVVQPHNHNVKLNLSTNIYSALRRHARVRLPGHRQLISKFAELEQALHRLAHPDDSNSSDDEPLSYYTLGQLQQELSAVNWTHLLQLQLGVTYPDSHTLLVDNVPAVRALIAYLNRADGRLLQLYSWARFLQYLLQLPHNPLSSSQSHNADAAIDCVQHMHKTLYLPMNYVYERNYYGRQREADEHVIYGVFEELKAQFAQQLRLNQFGLSAPLLQALLAKVHGLRLNVGNMPRNVTEEFFVEYDRHWRVANDFHENHLQSLLYYYKHVAELEWTQNATERQIWYSFNHHSPELLDNIDATPYFYCLGSIIIMPYAYVQLPFYDSQFWPALLYGDLANTLGHEMLHAFDTYFVDYDEQGNMRDYSDQLQIYGKYVNAVNCMNDSEHVMLNERIADISGTRLALQTYMRQPLERQQNGELYFLQFAQFFCGEEADIFHEKGSKRLNYVLAQMPEFAEVFRCSRGAPMNPVKRCSYW